MDVVIVIAIVVTIVVQSLGGVVVGDDGSRVRNVEMNDCLFIADDD